MSLLHSRMVEALYRLKETPRSGWVERGVRDSESVASHSYALAVISLLIAHEKGLDISRTVITALLHDLAESITGDLTPRMKEEIGREAAERTEESMLRQLFEELPQRLGELLSGLVSEYYSSSTAEAVLVRQLDKVEMALQAKRYLEQGRLSREEVEEFFESALREVVDPELRKVLMETRSSMGRPR